MFLISVLDGNEQSASCLATLIPGENTPGSHQTECFVGYGAYLGVVVERKITMPLPRIQPQPTNLQPNTLPTEPAHSH